MCFFFFSRLELVFVCLALFCAYFIEYSSCGLSNSIINIAYHLKRAVHAVCMSNIICRYVFRMNIGLQNEIIKCKIVPLRYEYGRTYFNTL